MRDRETSESLTATTAQAAHYYVLATSPTINCGVPVGPRTLGPFDSLEVACEMANELMMSGPSTGISWNTKIIAGQP